MLWWSTARQLHTVLAGGVAAFLLLLLLFQESTAQLPSFFASSASVVLILAAPVPLCAALMLCLESRLPSAEDTGVRPIRLLDTGVVLAALASALFLSLTVGMLLDSSPVLEAGRNSVFLVGLMLCVRPLAGSRAVMVPVCWIVVVALMGYDRFGHAHPWTVLPRPLTDVYALAITTFTLVAGLALQTYAARHESGRIAP
ncbi:hypothetical protein JGS22_001780 [Streptomyces sp. P38-E01]|uniref:Uncharacterized protein n=1 Tax=Streptomyces tardus TaxID=2780544 RepID=A0A949JJP4_9ACTN|nr:hypothetical protein [Streptomyces tardus]MBU7596401.1 hypothetical protein [Streptomyces tardus]